MAENARANFGNLAAGDIAWGNDTGTVEQRRWVDGVLTDTLGDEVNADDMPITDATADTLGLAHDSSVDAAIAALAGGGTTPDATTVVKGKVKMSVAPVSATAPIAVGDNDGRMLTNSTIAAAVNARTTATSTNYVLLKEDLNSDLYGTGKDGAFSLGSLTAPASAPTLADAGVAGYVPAGTYTVKVTFFNAVGETTPYASASNSITLGSAGKLSLSSIPTGGAGTAGRKIYVDDGSSVWRLGLVIPNNTDTTGTINVARFGTAAPGSNTTGATWNNVAGEYHFDGDMTISGATTLTGDAVIRCRGYVTISAAISGTGVGNGNSPLRADAGAVSVGTYHYTTGGPRGFNTNLRALDLPGSGNDGVTSGGTGGTKGGAGPTLVIYSYGTYLNANVTLNGGDGTAGSGGHSSGGGGGGGGILALVSKEYVKGGTVTVTTNGGSGGNGTSTGGGASKAWGGQPGGGGALIVVAPSVDIANVTHTKNVGSAGTNATNATVVAPPGAGGSSSGDGGAHYAGGSGDGQVRAATAGQTITSTTNPFALRI